MHRRLIRSLAPVLMALTVLLGACSSTPSENQAHLAEPAPSTTETATPAPPTTAPQPQPEPVTVDEPVATIARADTTLTALAQPDEGAAVVAELPATTDFGSPRALLVVDQVPGWVKVALPVRPNGTQGWLPASAVDLVAGDHRVVVDLAARTLTVFEEETVVLETPVAIGAPDAPTPTGAFFLVDRLQAPNPGGDYGPFALGVSGHSTRYSEFAGGDGQIGIHGTDDPSSIGQAVSHGCVRVPNDVVARLADLLPLGTPVTIA
jgi:lipoprotein-anchoring transpeptidase ErfK/SrfK